MAISESMRERLEEDRQRQKALSDPKLLKEREKTAKRVKREQKAMGVPSVAPTAKESARIGQAQKALGQKIQEPVNYGLEAFGVKVPSFLGMLGTGLANISNTKMYNTLQSGEGYPILDEMGNIVGVRDRFGRLTGRDPEAQRQAMMDRMDRDRPEQEAVPPNPVTGQCPAGYTYDANAQACMPVFASQVPTAFNYEAYTPAPTLLDQPSGLLDVAPMFGQPMDFNYGMPRVRLI